MKKFRLKCSIVLLFLLNTILGANNELVGSIEGDISVSLGIATYTLPVNTPKAAKGYSPNLSVNYRQGGSNGTLGLGFSLGGLSSISRCTTTQKIDDIKEGIAFNSEDKYCLDGKRLIEVSSNEYRLYSSQSVKILRSGSTANPSSWKVYSADGYVSEYGKTNKSKMTVPKGTLSWNISSKTDRFKNVTMFNYKKEDNRIAIDTITYQQYKVKFNYKNRLDQITTYVFGEKIVHKKLLENIETYVKGRLFSSYKMTYGKVDKSNNTTRFSRLKELRYCDAKGACLKPVRLAYEKREIYNKVEISAELDVDDLLNYVVADMNRDGFNDVCYYDGRLNCAMNKGNGEFESSTVWTAALNTNDENNVNAVKYGYGAIANGLTSQADKLQVRSAISSTLTLLDLNKDEYIDYCVATEGGVFCGLNSKNESFVADKFYTKEFTVEDAFRFTDINQDKKVDLCAFTSEGLKCSINNNDVFEAPIRIEDISKNLMIKQEYKFWKFRSSFFGGNRRREICDTTAPSYDDGEGYGGAACTETNVTVKVPQPQLLDINNDGFVDLCGLKTGTRDFYCAEGTGLNANKLPLFGLLKPWATNLPMGDSSGIIKIESHQKEESFIKDDKIKSNRFNRTIRFSDLNSDGLVDMCYRNENNFECRINNGLNFNDATTWITFEESDWPLIAVKYGGEADLQWIINNQESSIKLADKDGDGVVDFSAMVNNALVFASNQDGRFQSVEKIIDIVPDLVEINIRRNGVYTRPIKKWFGLKTDFHTVYGSLSYGPVKAVADLDGKENIETCYRDATGLACVAINKQPIALLKSVTSSLGLKTTLSYGKLLRDDFYIEQNNAKGLIHDYSPNSFLVKSIKTDNGVGGQNELSYEYEGFKTHKERGGLGFKKIIVHDPLKESRSVTTFNRSDSALNGRIEKSETYVRDTLVSTSTFEYDIVETASPKSKRVRTLRQESSTHDLNGALLSTKVVTNNKFNAFDQIESITETTRDENGVLKKLETQSTYENKTSTWILGKPTKVKVTHTANGDTVSKESTFEYNDKGELTKEVLEPSSKDALTSVYNMNNERTSGTVTVSDKQGNERKSYSTYDEYGRIISTKNVLGHKQSTTYDALCSLPKSVTGVNGLKTTFKYDSLCRGIKESLPDGNSVETFYAWSDGVDLGIDFQDVGVLDDDTSKYMVTSRSSVGGWGKTYFDALDRKVRSVSHATKLNKSKKKVTINVFTDYVYNNKGQVVASTIPYFEGMMAGAESQWIKVKYDVLGRTIEQSQPSPRGAIVTRMSYQGLSSTTSSPKA